MNRLKQKILNYLIYNKGKSIINDSGRVYFGQIVTNHFKPSFDFTIL